MNEKNFSTHESGTPFGNGDQLDVHAGNPNLISLDELERKRRRVAFEREALGAITPEQRPLGVHEQLGRLNLRVVGVRRNHIEKYNQGDLRKTA
jgi:hypothetical protein